MFNILDFFLQKKQIMLNVVKLLVLTENFIVAYCTDLLKNHTSKEMKFLCNRK